MLRVFNTLGGSFFTPTNYTSAFNSTIIQKSLINTVNNTNKSYNGVSTYYALRINGYICPGSSNTYYFSLYADDSAILCINDTLITSCVTTIRTNRFNYIDTRKLVSYSN